MIGLVIATHSGLAQELLNAAEMIIGPLPQARAVSVRKEDSVEAIRQEMAAAIGAVGADGDGVIIMTDMFGGTPANISLAFLEQQHIEVLTGVNLPMVLKCFNSQEGLEIAELAVLLRNYGQQGISVASDLLKR